MPLASPQRFNSSTGVGWLDAILDSVAHDPMGGLGPGSATVTNEAHPIFQTLAKQFPKVAAALQKMPSAVTFENGAAPTSLGVRHELSKLGDKLHGATTTYGPPKWPDSPAAGSTVWVNPAQTSQPKDLTTIHEVLHALYQGKQPGLTAPPEWAAEQILGRQPMTAMYPNAGEPAHKALHGMAERIWSRPE
jgi:hypothetical protein